MCRFTEVVVVEAVGGGGLRSFPTLYDDALRIEVNVNFSAEAVFCIVKLYWYCKIFYYQLGWIKIELFYMHNYVYLVGFE